MDPKLLLKRLDEIGRSLAQSDHALALIGLGSVGVELQRLDAYSDLDFFVIVESGTKDTFLKDLGWLSAVSPVAYSFRNTIDGYKLLFADGIFCEFAIFEPEELKSIPFAPGRVVWKQPHVAGLIGLPAADQARAIKRSPDWLLGEALTNLYVGLMREKRGERLSALRFIQGYAIDRLVELADQIEEARPFPADEFSPERRFEQRFPELARLLPEWTQGYNQNAASALASLAFLERHFEVNPAMAGAIRRLTEYRS